MIVRKGKLSIMFSMQEICTRLLYLFNNISLYEKKQQERMYCRDEKEKEIGGWFDKLYLGCF